jgi:hypothetical protein
MRFWSVKVVKYFEALNIHLSISNNKKKYIIRVALHKITYFLSLLISFKNNTFEIEIESYFS